jgi:hypothetical protein
MDRVRNRYVRRPLAGPVVYAGKKGDGVPHVGNLDIISDVGELDQEMSTYKRKDDESVIPTPLLDDLDPDIAP